MNSNSVANEIEKQTGLKRSSRTKKYAQECGRGNICYAYRFAGYRYSGDFHVAKAYGNTFEVITDSPEGESKFNDILQVLNNLGLEIVTQGRTHIGFKIPEDENKWYGSDGRYRKGKWRLWKKVYPEDTYCLSNSEDENFEYKFTAYSPSSAKSSADYHIEQLEKGEIMNSRKPIKSSRAKLHSDNIEDVCNKLRDSVVNSKVECWYDEEYCFITVTQKNNTTGNESTWSFCVDFGDWTVTMLEPTEDKEGFTFDNEIFRIIKNFLNGGSSREKRMNRPDYDSSEPIKITGKGNKIGSSRAIKSGYENEKYSQGYEDALDGKKPAMPNDKDYMAGYNDGKGSGSKPTPPKDYKPGDTDIMASRQIKSSKSVCIGFNTDNGTLLWKRDDLYTLDGSFIRQTKRKDIVDRWIEKYNLNTTDTERLDKYTQEGIGQIPWGLPLVEDKNGRNYNKELSEILPKHGIKSGYIIEVTETDNDNTFAPTYVNGNSWQSENPQIFETKEDAEEMADDFRKYLNKQVHDMHGRYQYKIKVIESSRKSIRSDFNPYYEKHPDTLVAYLVGDKDSITQEDIDKAEREWYKLFYEGYGTLYGDQGHLFIGPYSSIKAYVEDYLGLGLMDEYLHTYDYDHSVLDNFVKEQNNPLPTEKDYQKVVDELNAYVQHHLALMYHFNMYKGEGMNNDGWGNEYPNYVIFDTEGNLDMFSNDNITKYIRFTLQQKGWYPECVHSSSDFTIAVE